MTSINSTALRNRSRSPGILRERLFLIISLTMNLVLFMAYFMSFENDVSSSNYIRTGETAVSTKKTTRILQFMSQLQTSLDKGHSIRNTLQDIEDELTQDDYVTDSSTATVIAMASNYQMYDFRHFVGSLRKTGYQGHVILGVSPDVPKDVKSYLKKHNVTMKMLGYVNCTYKLHEAAKAEGDSHAKEMRTCVDPYPNIKIRWSRFPLARDWLEECKTCTGPVLVGDFRDLYFQRDPFVDSTISGLHVFAEYHTIRTTNWLVDWPVKDCKGVQFDEPMLCSGTTMGTRRAMLDYLSEMYKEMLLWMEDPKCNFGTNGDDQSIHNYLFFTGKLPFATLIPNRMGNVHTVGAQGSIIFEAHKKRTVKTHNVSEWDTWRVPFYGATDKLWLGQDFDMTDEEGYFINHDGTRSRVVHQYDRFGLGFYAKFLDAKQNEIWN